MVTVDSEGRVPIPTHLRDRLGIEPGSTLELFVEDGAVILSPARSLEEAPARSPEEIVETMEMLITESSESRGETTPLDGTDHHAKSFADTIHEAAESASESKPEE